MSLIRKYFEYEESVDKCVMCEIKSKLIGISLELSFELENIY